MTDSTERIRAEFEKWAKQCFGTLLGEDVQSAWAAWRAATEAALPKTCELIDLYTGPTGGWLVAPVFLKEEIKRALKPSADK